MPPVTITLLDGSGRTVQCRLTWPIPDDRIRAAWANDDDATRDGAYGIVLAAVEVHSGLVALERAYVGTGADYLVGPPVLATSMLISGLDYEQASLLEISGISRCPDEAALQRRARLKIRQARAGSPDLRTLAGVVAFNMLRVVFRSTD